MPNLLPDAWPASTEKRSGQSARPSPSIAGTAGRLPSRRASTARSGRRPSSAWTTMIEPPVDCGISRPTASSPTGARARRPTPRAPGPYRVVDDEKVEALAGPPVVHAARPHAALAGPRAPVGLLRVSRELPAGAHVQVAGLPRLARATPRVAREADARLGPIDEPMRDRVVFSSTSVFPQRGGVWPVRCTSLAAASPLEQPDERREVAAPRTSRYCGDATPSVDGPSPASPRRRPSSRAAASRRRWAGGSEPPSPRFPRQPEGDVACPCGSRPGPTRSPPPACAMPPSAFWRSRPPREAGPRIASSLQNFANNRCSAAVSSIEDASGLRRPPPTSDASATRWASSHADASTTNGPSSARPSGPRAAAGRDRAPGPTPSRPFDACAGLRRPFRERSAGLAVS